MHEEYRRSKYISRQAAIDDIKAIYEYHDTVTEDRIIDHLKRLPSAERHGRWLEHKDYPGLAYLCSECNWFTADRSFYCPHCGARMDGD